MSLDCLHPSSQELLEHSSASPSLSPATEAALEDTRRDDIHKRANLDTPENGSHRLLSFFIKSKERPRKREHKTVQVSEDEPTIINAEGNHEGKLNSSNRPLSLLDLPAEILKMIIYYIYLFKSSIIPIVTCCREIYDNFAYLIYMTKNVYIHNDLRFFKDGGSIANKTLEFINKHQSTVATQITVLTMKSNVPVGHLTKTISGNSELFLQILPKMRNLVVLTIESDEHQLLFESLCNLPPNLQVLRLYFKFTQRHLTKIESPVLPGDFLKRLSGVPSLEFIDIDSKKTTINLLPYKHPELGDVEPFNNQQQHRVLRTPIRSSIGHLITQLKGKDTTTPIKSDICEVIYQFLLKNRSGLIKVEIGGIDMNLIMSRIGHRFPFNFPKLRMLFFDTVTRETLSDWLPMFEELNKLPTYRNQLPLMMYYDRLSQRVYYKDTRYEQDRDDISRQADPCDFKNWSYSEQVATAYALLNQSRNIKY